MELNLLLLLLIANGTPILARIVLGEHFQCPLDGGKLWLDGRPLLGHAKTIRGVLSAILMTTLVAPIFAVSWSIGLLIGSFAMLGDLLSSFLKRRLGLGPSSMALGLDQFPESFIPLLVCQPLLDLSWSTVIYLTAAFFILELLISRLLYWLGIRKNPY